jgi:hypothetical protein
MAKTVKPKFILCIDWETSGTTWTTHEQTFKQFQGISFGAVIADAETFEPVETLYRIVKFDEKYTWSAEAEAIHGISRGFLAENGVDREDAALALAELIIKYFGIGTKVMFAGHNTWFDIHATKQLLEEFGVMPEIHHVVLDSAPTAFVAINEYKSDVVFDLLGGIVRKQHNALEDALLSLSVLRNINKFFATGLAAS